MLKKVLIGLAALVIVVCLAASTRPDTYSVTRTALVSAPPAVAYQQVADFHAWPRWSPWVAMEPDVKIDYTGAPATVGSTYHWVGKKTGEGRMTLAAAKPGERVDIKMDFIKPFTSTAQVDFTFAAEGAKTKVAWTIVGKQRFMLKVMGLVMNFEKGISKAFDDGLAKLDKASAEAAKKAAAAVAQGPAATPPAAAPPAAAAPAPAGAAAIPAAAKAPAK